jgi:hypothetical protein
MVVGMRLSTVGPRNSGLAQTTPSRLIGVFLKADSPADGQLHFTTVM